MRPTSRPRATRSDRLSDAVVAAAKAEGWKDLGDVKLAYCPMVKQSWLQKDEKIRNPYYGTRHARRAASSRSPDADVSARRPDVRTRHPP